MRSICPSYGLELVSAVLLPVPLSVELSRLLDVPFTKEHFVNSQQPPTDDSILACNKCRVRRRDILLLRGEERQRTRSFEFRRSREQVLDYYIE